MRPISKVPEEEFTKIVDERINALLELDKKQEKKTEKQDVTDVLQKMKDKESDKISSVQTSVHDHDNEISCPTCGNHIHKLTSNGLVAKCTGEKCGTEYIMVPKNADSKCTTCGMMWKKPNEKSNYEVADCPMCGNKRALEFNLKELIRQDKFRRV